MILINFIAASFGFDFLFLFQSSLQFTLRLSSQLNLSFPLCCDCTSRSSMFAHHLPVPVQLHTYHSSCACAIWGGLLSPSSSTKCDQSVFWFINQKYVVVCAYTTDAVCRLSTDCAAKGNPFEIILIYAFIASEWMCAVFAYLRAKCPCLRPTLSTIFNWEKLQICCTQFQWYFTLDRN